MVIVAQLVRAPVCGTGGRGFKSLQSPYLAFDAQKAGNLCEYCLFFVFRGI